MPRLLQGRLMIWSAIAKSCSRLWPECGSQKYTAILLRLLSSLCIAISRPCPYVMLSRMGTAMRKSLSEKACIPLAALAGLNSGSLLRISSRLVRTTKVPTALAFAAPLIRSSFQSPGNCRSSISGVSLWMLTITGLCELALCCEAHARCRRGGGWLSVRT
jgi:hypothetical protein